MKNRFTRCPKKIQANKDTNSYVHYFSTILKQYKVRSIDRLINVLINLTSKSDKDSNLTDCFTRTVLKYFAFF